ncbi:MAG: flagellar motor switch protein FliN [Armatimonadota bacterium]
MSDELLSQAEIEALLAQGDTVGDTQASPEPQADANAGADTNAQQPQMEAQEEVQDEQQTQQTENIPVQEPVIQQQPQVQAPKTQADNVRQVQFNPLSQGQSPATKSSMDLILDVQLQVAVELGKSRMKVKDVLALGPGSVIELDKHAGEPVEVVVNNKVVAKGEVVVIDENFGVRITEIISQGGRDSNARAA